MLGAIGLYKYLMQWVNVLYGRLRLRSSGDRQLLIPQTRTVILGPCAFNISGPASWNALPAALRDPAVTLGTFRQMLISFLFWLTVLLYRPWYLCRSTRLCDVCWGKCLLLLLLLLLYNAAMASCLRNNKSTSYNCISEFLITAKKNTRHERVSLQMNTTSNTSSSAVADRPRARDASSLSVVSFSSTIPTEPYFIIITSDLPLRTIKFCCLSHLHSTPSVSGFPSEYCHDVWYRKTWMVWLPDNEKDLKICLFVLTEFTNVTDRQTDRHRMTA